MKTKFTLEITIVFNFIILFLGCQSSTENYSSGENSAVPVTAAKIATMDVPHLLTQTGTLLGEETVLVKSETQGTVQKIFFEEGTKVKKGALLVKLDDAKIRAEIKRLKAQIEQYRIQLAHTERTLKRKKRLLKGDVISDQEFDDLIAKKGIEEALIEQAEATLITAQENLDDTEIHSPFDAMASERLVAEGDFVTVGAAIVPVVQVDPLKVSIRIFEKFKEKVHTGMSVQIIVEAFPGEEFTGKVFFISPDVDVKTRTFLLKARVPNPDYRLNPGMFANVSIEYEKHTGALIVPWEAIVQLEDRAFIFTIIDNKAHQIPVNVVKVFDDKVEVTGNLESGQDVVLDGKFTVEDGDLVAIQG